MHSYFLNTGINLLTIRCRELTTTASLHLHWTDLMGHQTGSEQVFPQGYDTDESLIEFVYTLPASGSDQDRLTLTSGSTQVWHGEVEVFHRHLLGPDTDRHRVRGAVLHHLRDTASQCDIACG